ncbi:hypothetical protein ACFTWF_44275 [Rhodococcus sp. NPDC056960]|uniref:hypothetical protein n=1 Tax=Rhodococcus sp. NPDC056960 TaxID=3345982 RepID=UPI00363078FB
MGRPSLERKTSEGRSPKVFASLTERDLAIVKSRARARGLTPAAYVRQIILGEIYPEGAPEASELSRVPA